MASRLSRGARAAAIFFASFLFAFALLADNPKSFAQQSTGPLPPSVDQVTSDLSSGEWMFVNDQQSISSSSFSYIMDEILGSGSYGVVAKFKPSPNSRIRGASQSFVAKVYFADPQADPEDESYLDQLRTVMSQNSKKIEHLVSYSAMGRMVRASTFDHQKQPKIEYIARTTKDYLLPVSEAIGPYSLNITQGDPLLIQKKMESLSILLEKTSDALAELFSLGFAHRDVKLENFGIEVDPGVPCGKPHEDCIRVGRLKLFDFDKVVPLAHKIENHQATGTVPYIAPEIRSPVSRANFGTADVFSLAASVLREAAGKYIDWHHLPGFTDIPTKIFTVVSPTHYEEIDEWTTLQFEFLKVRSSAGANPVQTRIANSVFDRLSAMLTMEPLNRLEKIRIVSEKYPELSSFKRLSQETHRQYEIYRQKIKDCAILLERSLTKAPAPSN